MHKEAICRAPLTMMMHYVYKKKNLIEFHNGALCTMVHYAQRGEICIRKNYFTAEVFEYPNKIAIPYCIYESAFYRIFERI